MKQITVNRKKLKHGSVSVALTAVVVALVVIFNVIITLLGNKFNLYIDLTAESLYTLSQECKDLLRENFEDFAEKAAEANPGVGRENEATLQSNEEISGQIPAFTETVRALHDEYYNGYQELFDFFESDSLSSYYAQYLAEYRQAYDAYFDKSGASLAVSELTDDMKKYNDAVSQFNTKISTLNNYISGMNRIIKRANARIAVLNETSETPAPEYEQLSRYAKLAAFQESTVQIIFCKDADNLMADAYSNYVYQTAQELHNAFPDIIEVECVNIYNNPSAVQRFKATSGATIYDTDVIVASGTEYRLYGQRTFFVFENSSSTTPWAYNGERYLATAILAVTRAQSPVCALTVNHGETVYDYELLYNLTYSAGYQIMYLDLLRDEIPDDCRLILTFNPKTDFISYFDDDSVEDGVSEIDKLDRFLDKSNSFLLFIDAYTPELKNLEEYMEEWGITVCRANVDGDNYNYLLKDPTNSLTSNGTSILAEPVTTGLASTLLRSMTESTTMFPSVVFKNSTALGVSDMYNLTDVEADEDSGTPAFTYYEYYGNGVTRRRFDIFKTSEGSYADAAGQKVDATGRYTTMVVTYEADSATLDSYGNTISNHHYFGVISSTEFASEDFLQSATFGNTDVMLSVLRTMGRENVGVGLKFKPFADETIDSITTVQMVRDTVLLAAIPAVLALVAGVVVMIRRRNT